MIEAQLNLFDIIVLLVLVLSTVLAFFRGFVREVLSLGAWIGAAIITLYAFEPVAEILKPHTGRDILAYLIAGMGTYLVTLVTISLFNALIIRYLKSGEEVGMLDNFLGLAFGGLRGMFIISLGYLVLSLVIDEENPPAWVEEAGTREIAREGALVLSSIAPGYLEDISSLTDSLKEQQAQEDKKSGDENSTLRNDIDNAIRDTGQYLFGKDDGQTSLRDQPVDREKPEKGYSQEERFLLDNLMRSRNSGE